MRWCDCSVQVVDLEKAISTVPQCLRLKVRPRWARLVLNLGLAGTVREGERPFSWQKGENRESKRRELGYRSGGWRSWDGDAKSCGVEGVRQYRRWRRMW
ncbi:hypothetical protein HPP92_025970 [Vanilla planifolia]|uniref:Uncharacterized protein n=1 Tax=Vanilla planifolia TaxID=51239 RepID=A0A835U6Z9_VANPL|nr:hypothetical protein HPP92_026240 [Vanilla planifolia]KAG0451959.1 hypothetical protein HPP92_025970 [Vanilla planifolia]